MKTIILMLFSISILLLSGIVGVNAAQFSAVHQFLRARSEEVDVLHTTKSLTECLLSASNSTDCAAVGCVWCAEPVYGLCVTENAAKRMNPMPFFTCNMEAEW